MTVTIKNKVNNDVVKPKPKPKPNTSKFTQSIITGFKCLLFISCPHVCL